MAPSLLAPRLAVPVLLLVLAAAAAAAEGVAGAGMTHLHFFIHEVFTAGPNATTATVVAPPARSDGGSSSFGFVGVVDDMLREGADPASRLVGRAQGVTAGTSLADGAITTMLNLVFTEEGPYAGSTLQVFGRAVLGTVMERPVVGGTGKFRMARGYTLSRRVNSSDPDNLLVIEYDAYVTTSPI
uniref:Dirigent protein n=1 Tax=Oryza meridionalis TaxID=40149 RepID=A0A0E0EXG1_9ORYZ